MAQASLTKINQPIDYAFKEVKSIHDFLYETPVSGKPANPPISKELNAPEFLLSLPAFEPPAALEGEEAPASPGGTLAMDSKASVRLCNNALNTIKGIDRLMMHLLQDPLQLTWLDLSCNHLTSIEPELLKFVNLQVLYLHGNRIGRLHDVLSLNQLPRLQKATLHGNPISEKPQYKLWILAHLPKLKNLDFSGVTKLDRDRVEQWHRGYLKQQEARNK